MTDNIENSGNLADDMSQYLQTFLDETEEQLDDLVETMLALEHDPTNKDDLNEAFRLIHSIKGSAGMMGFDNISVLTHHLENRFERLRAGLVRLNQPTMNLVLRCIDFLRHCNNRLRDGEELGSSTELLGELRRLEEQADVAENNVAENNVSEDNLAEDNLAEDNLAEDNLAEDNLAEDNLSENDAPEQSTGDQQVQDADITDSQSTQSSDEQDASIGVIRMVIRFRAGLQLADLKAQLIVARLSGLGTVKSTQPNLDQLADAEQFEEFEVQVETQKDLEHLRAAADVDGVESIKFSATPDALTTESALDEASRQDVATDEPVTIHNETVAIGPTTPSESKTTSADQPAAKGALDEAQTEALSTPEVMPTELNTAPTQHTATSEPSATEKATAKVVQTMRVDIDRLDDLMNLAGELVVNRARFVQISAQISPALRKASAVNRIRDFSDSLKRTIESLENDGENRGDYSAQIQQLRAGLEMLDEQSEIWDNGRHCFSQMSEAIDQLSRVSHSLQRGVLDTRMVPVTPLFNRFKRVIRDLSQDRGKKVNLLIRGEKTELDKRMIDELGDPLVHLVRNSIDHGLEPPDVRVSRGKPEVGTIFLEASHSGNNVYIHVRDDGGGIDVGKIKAKLMDNRVLSASAIDELSDEQALEYIWHPGFSTAKEVTDVSGRGVGMDVVKTRINQLNGTIEVDSTPPQGTAFTIRLPLTLAIINSLLIRLRDVTFSIPMDDVREIVSVEERDVVTVHGKQTFDVRGEYIPVVSIDDVFAWHGIDYGYNWTETIRQTDSSTNTVAVVILTAGGKAMGLRVDELLGSQDIVIKSLSDNFINIRGLSGASILGDGSVCLMLDVDAVMDMAI